MQNFLLGWAISSTLIALFLGYLLYKKPSTTNEIDRVKEVNKRIKNSTIDNKIHADITGEKRRKRRLNKNVQQKKD